jgi:UDP-3-O-[3-hydroxymyristoyl] glucosamine N-acyltransferase
MEAVIGKFCVIEDGAVIGDGVKIGDFCIVRDGAVIGDGVVIGNYCEIRNDCVIGSGTTLGSRCTLSAGTRIGNNVIAKFGFTTTDTPKLGSPERRPCVVGDAAKFGAWVTLMPGVKIGDGVEVGACSQVRHSIASGVWFGNPAKHFRPQHELERADAEAYQIASL